MVICLQFLPALFLYRAGRYHDTLSKLSASCDCTINVRSRKAVNNSQSQGTSEDAAELQRLAMPQTTYQPKFNWSCTLFVYTNVLQATHTSRRRPYRMPQRYHANGFQSVACEVPARFTAHILTAAAGRAPCRTEGSG